MPDGRPKICLAIHYNFVMIARHLQGLTAALVSAADEVDRPQPVVERAAAALLLERNPQGGSGQPPPWPRHSNLKRAYKILSSFFARMPIATRSVRLECKTYLQKNWSRFVLPIITVL